MGKKFFYFLTLMLLALPVSLLAQTVEYDTLYSVVNSVDGLAAGDKVLVLGKNGSDFYALGYQKTSNRGAVAVTLVNGSYAGQVATDNANVTLPYELTLGGTAGAWTLYDAVDTTYLRPKTGSSNGFVGNAEAAAFTLAIASEGAATLTYDAATYARNILRFNTSGLFACYASGQTDVYL